MSDTEEHNKFAAMLRCREALQGLITSHEESMRQSSPDLLRVRISAAVSVLFCVLAFFVFAMTGKTWIAFAWGAVFGVNAFTLWFLFWPVERHAWRCRKLHREMSASLAEMDLEIEQGKVNEHLRGWGYERRIN